MKLQRIALAVALAAPAAMSAQAGVTLTPVLLGYHYTGEAHDEQREEFLTGQQLNTVATTGIDGPANGGVAKESSLYTGIGLGIELTPSVGLELEYGVSKANGEASEASAKIKQNRFDVDQRNITANLVVTSDLITQNYSGKFKPYALVGAGIADYEITNQVTGEEVYNQDHTIGNLGLGAYYRINDALTLRGEGRGIYNFDGEWVEGLALAGLQVVLGGHLQPDYPAPPEPEVVVDTPTDSDGDGVVDSLDKCPGTPPNVVVDADGCPKQVEEDLKMELRIFYDINKSIIKPQYRPEVAKVAEKMKQYPNATAMIEGHTSKTGPRRLNERLGVARANSVKSMLVSQYGINPARMTTKGYAWDRPIAPNNTAEGRAMNRRTYAVITGSKTETMTK